MEREFVTLRLPADLKSRLVQRAKTDNISLNALILKILHGFIQG